MMPSMSPAPTHQAVRRSVVHGPVEAGLKPQLKRTGGAASDDSPLPWLGGKSRAVPFLTSVSPPGMTTLVSVFGGGCSFEISIAQSGVKAKVFDNNLDVVNYWQIQGSDPVGLARRIEMVHEQFGKEEFHYLRRLLPRATPYTRAAIFYSVVRASFNKDYWRGGYTLRHPRFTHSCIEKVRNFNCPNLDVRLQDFRETLHQHPYNDLYLDPIYYLDKIVYGMRGTDFAHEELARLLGQHKGRFLLSYNDHPYIRQLYRDYIIIPASHEWKYGANKSKRASEIVVLNYDVPAVGGSVDCANTVPKQVR